LSQILRIDKGPIPSSDPGGTADCENTVFEGLGDRAYNPGISQDVFATPGHPSGAFHIKGWRVHENESPQAHILHSASCRTHVAGKKWMDQDNA
jgi:hypothetical protein